MQTNSTSTSHPSIYDCIVIGAGQAGLAASYYLKQRGITHLVLDANQQMGGAWSHRWDSLTMKDVHGVADLPGTPAPSTTRGQANRVIPEYFKRYEETQQLPILRPVKVERVSNDPADPALLIVEADRGGWKARTIINATGTWTKPFLPHYPGARDFTGKQFHTASYPGPATFTDKKVLVVGAGASAVQFIGELAGIARDILWATRRPPIWRTENTINGLEAVT